jgi:hypothetical protein
MVEIELLQGTLEVKIKRLEYHVYIVPDRQRFGYVNVVVQCTSQHWWRSVPASTGGAVYQHWWRSVPALVVQCVKGLLPW